METVPFAVLLDALPLARDVFVTVAAFLSPAHWALAVAALLLVAATARLTRQRTPVKGPQR
jgi:hypothetical protein